jgi:hypothetical protein
MTGIKVEWGINSKGRFSTMVEECFSGREGGGGNSAADPAGFSHFLLVFPPMRGRIEPRRFLCQELSCSTKRRLHWL